MYLSEGTGDVRTAYIFENADDAKESFDMSYNNPHKFAKCIRTEERLMPSEDARWWIDISQMRTPGKILARTYNLSLTLNPNNQT